jgi:hypothetical protein
MAYAVELLSTANGKENHMKTKADLIVEKPKLKLASAIQTIWAIGIGAWSGMALTG